jgi:hypothetical protein
MVILFNEQMMVLLRFDVFEYIWQWYDNPFWGEDQEL